jgi:hypothetical protein
VKIFFKPAPSLFFLSNKKTQQPNFQNLAECISNASK